MEQKEAKIQIAKLVEKYKKLSPAEIKGYSEEETKKGFIEPLFKALGWDFTNKGEVSAEEHIKSSGLADYGFYINGRAKFYLEAKSLKADLYKEEYARQAIRYSFNKVVTWAVLTDFKNLKVFNANAISDNLGDKQYLSIAYTEYLDRFDELWLLSRNAFEEDLIDVEATKAGKLLQKVSVTDKLYEDLNKCRILLTKSLSDWNRQVPKDLIDEGVQKLLDRLIFMRVAEDRKVEPHMLKELIRTWNNRDKKDSDVTLYQSMTEKFRELDAIYNSNLFSKHPFEDWEEHNKDTERVINILYGKEGYYEYDFKFIPADVLGNIYENYLGYQLQQSEKGLTTSKDAKKRKEQGIYYTPPYIVDYIVSNALKPVLDKCESVADLKQIKVLDPACGSGSFLLRAMELIADKYKEFNYEDDELNKIRILEDNIYGVDLDEKAVEIARLNLLINSLERRMKLPNLAKNIKNGNSLISGTDQELEAAFGKDYRDKIPFNWQEEFPEVFKRDNPGFDVIIGNPPYVNLANIKSEAEREYLKSNYETARNKSDLYSFFTEKAITVLRNNGSLGFIFPNTWLGTDSFSRFRKYMFDNTRINRLVRLQGKVFASATVTTMLVFLTKQSFHEDYDIELIEGQEGGFQALPQYLSTQRIASSPNYQFSMNPELKFTIPTKRLGDIAKFSLGIKTSDDKQFISKHKKDNDSYLLLRGKDVERYDYHSAGYWIWYRPELMMKKTGAGPRKLEYFLQDKILFRSITGGSIMAAIDRQLFLTNDKVHVLYSVEGYDLLSILGIVNSKLMQTWVRATFNDLLEIKINQLEEIPVPDLKVAGSSTRENLKTLSHYVQKMIDLHGAADSEIPNSNDWQSLQAEIEKVDGQIDQLVYELYEVAAPM